MSRAPSDSRASYPTPVSEEQCLYQIYIDELYGGLQRPSEDEKKKGVGVRGSGGCGRQEDCAPHRALSTWCPLEPGLAAGA